MPQPMISTGRRVGQRWRRWASAGVALAACALGAGAYLAVGAVSADTVPAGPYVAASVATGGQSPASLAIDSRGTAWVWTVGTSDEVELFSWAPAGGQVRTFDVGDASALHLNFGAASGIAISRDGTVWLGANRTLVSFDPGTGAVGQHPLPDLATDAGSDGDIPSAFPTTQFITALAAGPGTQIAVAVENAPVVPLLDPATRSWSAVALPAGSDAGDVAYGSAGTLAVAVVDWATGTNAPGELLLVAPDGATTTVPDLRNQEVATAAATGFVAGDADKVVSTQGTVSTGPPPAAPGGADLTDQVEPKGHDMAASGGAVAWMARSGIVIDAGGTTVVDPLPEQPCGALPSLEPRAGASVRPTPTRVAATSSTSTAPATTGTPMCATYPAGVFGSAPSDGFYVLTDTAGHPLYFLPDGALP